MKISRHNAGFTLIELLTVIAIIGILAAIIIPTTGAVQNAAKKSKTKAQFSNWVNAAVLFKQEYGFYPDIAVTNKLNPERFAGALTGRSLEGAAITDTTLLYNNRKKLSFYSFSDADLDNATNPTAINDAFGNTDIAVYVDRDANGLIETSAPDSAGRVGVAAFQGPTFTPASSATGIQYPVRAPIIFYSAGKGSSATDIIYSWK